MRKGYRQRRLQPAIWNIRGIRFWRGATEADMEKLI